MQAQPVSVRPAQVGALADRIRAAAKAMGDELDTLDAAAMKLRAGWHGEAQQAYDEAQELALEAFDHVQQTLWEIANRTETAAGRFAGADTAALRRFER